MKKTIHLICNAHLDPVWLWEWEEGAAEVISTFRTAADLCEADDGFVFNHNEAVLYQWVEEYEPALFARIQRLVKQKKWHIMGGWFLQPDCNMPSGESFVRQILTGRQYFRDKFDVEPTTAINFDPFGHTRGLVQIMAKSGYDSYIFCRPNQRDCPLPNHEFVWVGYDGSEILASRCLDWYNSPLGRAREKIEGRMADFPDQDFCYLLWGVGNHGGGPSRKDVEDITALIGETRDVRIVHSTPEVYFSDLGPKKATLPRHEADLNPWAPGCYTSQVRIKQLHRLMENELYAVEKMISTAALQSLMDYPREELCVAERDLLFSEFHDILPGSSIQPVENMSLRVMDHGLEILSRLKARAFFAMAQGQPKAKEGQIPVLVYNPHPFKIRTVVECEFQLADQNHSGTFVSFTAHRRGRALPSQVEKELSNIALDWRKRLVFVADLAPSQMNRFDCVPEALPAKPKPRLKPKNGRIRFRNEQLEVWINTRTGLLDKYAIDGVDYVGKGAGRPLVIADDEDPWGTRVQEYRAVEGAFKLMSKAEGTRLSGVSGRELPSVRIIEDGAARTVVEAIFSYGDSFLIQHYKLPKFGTEMEVTVRVHWNEKDKFLKLSIPVPGGKGYVGQVAYGVADLPDTGREAVAQKWVGVAREDGTMLTCANDGSYGSDYCNAELRLSLMRSPAYSAHPVGDNPIMPPDRYSPRIDQGERLFRFWLNAGPQERRLEEVDREALVRNEKPMALSFFPSGTGQPVAPGPRLSDRVIQLTALKQAEDGKGFLVRLFNPTAQPRKTTLTLPALGHKKRVSLKPYEIRSLRFLPASGEFSDVSLIEQAE